jgi:hypothetical protein
MWTPSQPARTDWNAGKVVPKVVLFSYDGPLVFTAQVGLTDFLFFKIGEDSNSDLYLIAPTSDATVDALKMQSLSIRGALAQTHCWVVDVAPDNEVRRYWPVNPNDVPQSVLPIFGLALAPTKASVADILEQAIAFFSARFTGENLSQASIPFIRFKMLIDAAYDSFRKIFPAPVYEARSLNRSLDFDLLQPKFSSLIIAIDRPRIDENDVRKYMKTPPIDYSVFVQEFEKNRQDFFERIGELVSEAEKGEIKKSYAIQHFITLDQVNEIVPTTSNELDRVEFRSHAPSLRPVAIDDKLGDKFREAHRIAELAPRRITGVVVEINDDSATFVIREESSARQVTCVFERNIYEDISMSLGDRVQVRGDFTQRKRRDKIIVESAPQILPKSSHGS